MSTTGGSLPTWLRQPEVVILAAAGDYRLADTHAAIAWWNRQLEEIGSGLRLDPVRTISEFPASTGAYAEYLSKFTLSRVPGAPNAPAPGFLRYCGAIVVFLADNRFISVARAVPNYGLAFAAIQSGRQYLFTLPNVARNVIAHEIGHTLGLRHNGRPGTLMCSGGPCRPDTMFSSSTERFFPLTEAEKRLLRNRYPAGWPAGG